jgi:hypothetical protein
MNTKIYVEKPFTTRRIKKPRATENNSLVSRRVQGDEQGEQDDTTITLSLNLTISL